MSAPVTPPVPAPLPPTAVGSSAAAAQAAVRANALQELLGVRSSKGRYYSEYRHSSHDLERTLLAVNAVSWVLADAPRDARYLVDSTLPVIAQLLQADAVVLVSDGVRLGAARAGGPRERGGVVGAVPPLDDGVVAALLTAAARVAPDCGSNGVMRALPEMSRALLLAPLPGSAPGREYVVAAVPLQVRADATDLALLGTLTNQLAGALQSTRRLAESEALREAADAALREADEQARALARRNELLKQTRTELAAVREQQVLADERQRIARDLHDSVAQHVLSMGMQVEWCRTTSDQPDLVDKLSDIKELARTTVDRIRAAIFQLSDGDELQRGLVPALRRLAEQHRRSGLPTAVRVRGEAGDLPCDVQRALYMAAKEALFNTAVHAEAGRAQVQLLSDAERVRLQVTDDGAGSAEQLLSRLRSTRLGGNDGYHRGLVNIEDRARLVGGRLTISDPPGGGVRVTVDVPRSGQDRR